MFDEEPGRARVFPARPEPDENPRAFELGSLERELQVALLERGVDVLDFGLPDAAVPDHHDAAAVLSFRDDSLESVVLDWMILRRHRHPFDGRIERRPLRHRPGEHHAVPLETQVVVELGRAVLLHDELESLLSLCRALFAFRLKGDLEVALELVLFQAHEGDSLPDRDLTDSLAASRAERVLTPRA
jgi:hypothetical protein